MPARAARFTHWWGSLGLWRGYGLAASAALLLLALGTAHLARQAAQAPVLVAVLLSDQNRPAAVVNAFRDGRTELLALSALRAPEGKSLQVWTLWDRARGPVSVGLLEAMRNVELERRGPAAPGGGTALRGDAGAGRRLPHGAPDRADPDEGQCEPDRGGHLKASRRRAQSNSRCPATLCAGGPGVRARASEG
ncbi:anti-sigma factor domain-containing protein [Ancylobacter dichloromethanicus]